MNKELFKLQNNLSESASAFYQCLREKLGEINDSKDCGHYTRQQAYEKALEDIEVRRHACLVVQSFYNSEMSDETKAVVPANLYLAGKIDSRLQQLECGLSDYVFYAFSNLMKVAYVSNLYELDILGGREKTIMDTVDKLRKSFDILELYWKESLKTFRKLDEVSCMEVPNNSISLAVSYWKYFIAKEAMECIDFQLDAVKKSQIQSKSLRDSTRVAMHAKKVLNVYEAVGFAHALKDTAANCDSGSTSFFLLQGTQEYFEAFYKKFMEEFFQLTKEFLEVYNDMPKKEVPLLVRDVDVCRRVFEYLYTINPWDEIVLDDLPLKVSGLTYNTRAVEAQRKVYDSKSGEAPALPEKEIVSTEEEVAEEVIDVFEEPVFNKDTKAKKESVKPATTKAKKTVKKTEIEKEVPALKEKKTTETKKSESKETSDKKSKSKDKEKKVTKKK